jgi:HTH-type transcriptional regulator/antitoxin HigA
MNTIDFEPILSTWQPFHNVSAIGHIKNEAHYDRMVALADRLIETGAANDGHEFEDLFLLICDLIGQYDDRHYAPVEVAPSDMLGFLMAQHGLKESDFPEVGSQEVIASILNGKTEITVRQIKALSGRFSISPGTFL